MQRSDGFGRGLGKLVGRETLESTSKREIETLRAALPETLACADGKPKDVDLVLTEVIAPVDIAGDVLVIETAGG